MGFSAYHYSVWANLKNALSAVWNHPSFVNVRTVYLTPMWTALRDNILIPVKDWLIGGSYSPSKMLLNLTSWILSLISSFFSGIYHSLFDGMGFPKSWDPLDHSCGKYDKTLHEYIRRCIDNQIRVSEKEGDNGWIRGLGLPILREIVLRLPLINLTNMYLLGLV